MTARSHTRSRKRQKAYLARQCRVRLEKFIERLATKGPSDRSRR